MGTGKTVQALSAIARDHTGPTLVVCPTSVIHNWQRESARFTPKLKVCVYHGPDRALGNCDIVITSYGLLRSDADLAKLSWHRVIFDEAQALKNHLSKAFKAAMRVQATHRLVMTGTPVENHIGDLWSLMQLVNPGLLGSYARFMARYRVKYNRAELAQQSPDEHSDRATAGLSEAGLSEAGLSEAGLCETDLLVESYARLRQLIAPFVLRREKTDPGVADDLPEKFTTKEECRLTKEQIGLYNATVSTMLESAEQAGSEFARRGAILTGIMRLKQICTHPSMATATAGAIAGRSGKVERIEGLLAEIVDEGSAALIFTQWTAWMGPLAAHLSKVLGREVLTLEGKMTTKARQKVIDRFNASDGPPVLIVSLKAGGSGLNLVRATHVLHADRWWNPAVEQQATDRAHRIGQTRSVQVHTMICPGTVEDRIDQLLEEKRATASAVVRSGETQITELSTAELHDFVALITEEVLR
jgi:non-specific serine/threonine protein kinase